MIRLLYKLGGGTDIQAIPVNSLNNGHSITAVVNQCLNWLSVELFTVTTVLCGWHC